VSLITWSWIFLFAYIGLMVGIGLYAQRRDGRHGRTG
jgi:hypothetical protein